MVVVTTIAILRVTRDRFISRISGFNAKIDLKQPRFFGRLVK